MNRRARAVPRVVAAGALLLSCTSSACTRAGTCGHVPEAPPTIVVTDSSTGAPICDATVSAVLVGEDLTLVVGPVSLNADASNCEYVLEGPPGTYNITASRAGYQDAIVRGLVELNDWCGALGSNPPQVPIVTMRLTPS